MLTPAQMTTNLQTRLRAASVEDKRYMLSSFLLGGLAFHHITVRPWIMFLWNTWGAKGASP